MSPGKINPQGMSRRRLLQFFKPTPIEAAVQRQRVEELRKRLESESELSTGEDVSQARKNGERLRSIVKTAGAIATDSSGVVMDKVLEETDNNRQAIKELRKETDLIQVVLDGVANAGDLQFSRRDMITSPIKGATKVGIESTSWIPVIGPFVRFFRYITGT